MKDFSRRGLTVGICLNFVLISLVLFFVGTEVRIAAQGPQVFRVLGVHDMSEIYHLMARALGAE